MKKLVNSILGTALAIMVSSVFIIGFTGCKTDAGNDDDNKNHTAKSTDLIKFNISDAKYLATQWVDAPKGKEANANVRAAGSDAKKHSLIKITEDNKEEPVIEIMTTSKENTNDKLASWCEPQPVREVYKCPYPNIPDKAKGVYTVFAGYVDWWKYKDETPAQNIGQTMYVQADGTTKDILNDDGDIHNMAVTQNKEFYGEEYIQFDKEGNIFILTNYYAPPTEPKDYKVYRYNPTNDDVTAYTVNLENKKVTEIFNFCITKDGNWIFLNTEVDGKYRNIYALQTNNKNSTPIALYEFDKSKSENTAADWPSLGINPKTNDVYWYVNEWETETHANCGLYIARYDNGYSNENVEFYSGLDERTCWNPAAKFFINKEQKDYEGFLDYLKSFCRPDRKTDNIEFNLSKFKNMTNVEIKNPYNNETTGDFSKLYKEDENGDVLKDEAALKYLFETKYGDVYPEKTWVSEENRNLSLWESIFKDFIHLYYNYKVLGDKFYDSNEYSFTYCPFPLDFVMFKKDNPTETAFEMPSEYVKSKEFIAMCKKGYFLANDDGVWVYSTAEDFSCAKVFKLIDKYGAFVCSDEEDKLSELNWNKSFKPVDYSKRKDTDPWYKKPFAINTNGFAAISKDQKTIFYHSNGVTKDLQEKDQNKSNIKEIYSFSLDDDKLIYNANAITNDGSVIVSIDLTSGDAETPIPVTTEVESMLCRK